MLAAFDGLIRETLGPSRATAAGMLLLQSLLAALMLAMPWFAAGVVDELLQSRLPTQLMLLWLAALALCGLLEYLVGLLGARLEARIAAELGCNTAQLAIAWINRNPRVSTVILGASRIEQLHDNLGALAVTPKLTAEVVERIDAIAKPLAT